MPQSALFTLPLLHKELNHILHNNIPSLQHIWPGLPHIEQGYWQAQNYPLSPKEAQAFLQELTMMSEAALSGVPLQALIVMDKPRAKAQDLNEQEVLQNFVESGQLPNSDITISKHMLYSGQKFLLWAWLLEERHKEVCDLSEEYTKNASSLMAALHVEKDEALSGLESLENSLANTDSPLPSWKIVFENAALFLPEKTSIIINSTDMTLALQELEDSSPLSIESKEKFGLHNMDNTWREANLTVASILQCKVSAEEPWLGKEFHCIFKGEI